MFRNLFRIFRKETVAEGSASTKDAVLLLGYRFAGHCRNAETKAAGEREFYKGLKTTLTESKIVPPQGEANLGVSALPLLSCNGFVTGNVIPFKIMLEDQTDVVDRINTALPSHVRVFDVIETSPEFEISGWDRAVCSCYIPTCLLNSSAKDYIGHRISESTISKLHETSKQFCSLKDFSAFKIGKQTSVCDSVTKFDILPCFHQNGCEYIQLIVGFKGLTIEEIQRVVGVSLAVARNDLVLEEILDPNSKIELPYFPRLMLDEVQFDSYNKSLEGNKTYRQIDWSLLQGAQNEFKRKLFLPQMVEQDTSKIFWWNEFISRQTDKSSKGGTQISDIISSTKRMSEINNKDTDRAELKTTEISGVQTNMLKIEQGLKVQEDVIEEKSNNIEVEEEIGKEKIDSETVKPELEYRTGIEQKKEINETAEQINENQINELITGEKARVTEETSQNKNKTKPSVSTKNVNSNSESLVENINSVKRLKERLAMNSVKTEENDQERHDFRNLSSNIPEDFLAFAKASVDSFNAYLSNVENDLSEGKKVQLEMREQQKSPVDLMKDKPTQVDEFWSFYKTLDQIELSALEFLDLCGDLHTVLKDKDVNKKLTGRILTPRRKKIEVSIEQFLSKLEKCFQDIKVLKQGQDEIIDGMVGVILDSKEKLKSTESIDNTFIHVTDIAEKNNQGLVNNQNNKQVIDVKNEQLPDKEIVDKTLNYNKTVAYKADIAEHIHMELEADQSIKRDIDVNTDLTHDKKELEESLNNEETSLSKGIENINNIQKISTSSKPTKDFRTLVPSETKSIKKDKASTSSPVKLSHISGKQQALVETSIISPPYSDRGHSNKNKKNKKQRALEALDILCQGLRRNGKQMKKTHEVNDSPKQTKDEKVNGNKKELLSASNKNGVHLELNKEKSQKNTKTNSKKKKNKQNNIEIFSHPTENVKETVSEHTESDHKKEKGKQRPLPKLEELF